MSDFGEFKSYYTPAGQLIDAMTPGCNIASDAAEQNPATKAGFQPI
jgi:hypothetical protein